MKDMSEEKECHCGQSHRLALTLKHFKDLAAHNANLLSAEEDKRIALEQRLSQAEAENKELKVEIKEVAAGQICNYCFNRIDQGKDEPSYEELRDQVEESRLIVAEHMRISSGAKARLSHLMDVAGNAIQGVDGLAEDARNAQIDGNESWNKALQQMAYKCEALSRRLTAEWDGINSKERKEP